MNNPKCPYCGAEMHIKNMYETVAFACACGAMSPMEYTEEAALAAANRCMQRPLTLEELNAGDVVYLEFKDDDEIIPIQILPEALSPNLLAYFKCGWAARFNLDMLGYGRYCRCWAQMPTDEERAAAEWEN